MLLKDGSFYIWRLIALHLKNSTSTNIYLKENMKADSSFKALQLALSEEENRNWNQFYISVINAVLRELWRFLG